MIIETSGTFFRLSSIVCGFIFLFSTSYAEPLNFTEPPNLSLVKQQVKIYHDSGRYEKELASVIAKAQDYILQQITDNAQHGNKKKLAVILDIDETSLSNYNRMVQRDFIGDKNLIHKDILAADAPAIYPMLSFYHNAQKHGVNIFFVTGRPQSELQATKINLTRAGYHHWAGLYLRPNHYNQSSIVPFKSQTRAAIAQQGYTIIASIGDQYSDLKGGYAQKGFKLPNPFYYLP
ncbi:HAD family acid phosphatase [Legionella fairfieldensis]|uniref:HAD family acid phosphatase n=1 Tax=Legionella fairfieldensis TaxID=45064 RepID=UPI00048E7D96|nr:HAD family acid phosphatase [Legionella fairfieldensis]